MDAIRGALAAEDAAALLELLTVEAGPDALDALPAVLRRLAPESDGVLVTQDRRPFTRGGADLKPMVAERLRAGGLEVEVLELGDGHGHMESDVAEVDQLRRPVGRHDRGVLEQLPGQAGGLAGRPIPLRGVPRRLGRAAGAAGRAGPAARGRHPEPGQGRPPLRYDDLGVPEEQARWAFQHGHLMRDRFSSADLLNYLGWLDGAFVDEVFAEYRRLVAGAA